MNILMIALHYHGYTEAIAAELRALGHEVSLHDLQPRDFVMKTMRLVTPSQWQARLDQHHLAILESVKNETYDLVLFIQAHQVSKHVLERFRAEFGSARFALYNWDSLHRHDYLDRQEFFDTVQTFDPEDAKRHGFIYLPLFATRAFQKLNNPAAARKSVYFVGNIINPERYRSLAEFETYAAEHDIRFEAHRACTLWARVWMLWHGVLPLNVVSGEIPEEQFQAMVHRSAATFDFANHTQAGFTMRVIENLCAGKKIITNNPGILEADFYSPDRFHFFENKDYTGVNEFLEEPLAEPERTFRAYHIQAFAKHLADGTGHPLPGIGRDTKSETATAVGD